jgi:hypothetical protein
MLGWTPLFLGKVRDFARKGLAAAAHLTGREHPELYEEASCPSAVAWGTRPEAGGMPRRHPPRTGGRPGVAAR